VICPTLTFVATANAIRYVGAKPVFCESSGPMDLNIDIDDVIAKINARTKAIVVVHFAGYPVDMRRISAIAKRHGLRVIEDCAHAFVSTLDGRTCGTWGNVGCFSFFSNKNATCGEGGAIVTDDSELAERIRHLRAHGMTTRTIDRHLGRADSYDVVDSGYNYRIDEIRASLLLAQLSRLEGFLSRRRVLDSLYREKFNRTPITIPDFQWARIRGPNDFVGPHIMPVLLPEYVSRTHVMAALRERGIQSSIHYPPVHKFTSYASEVKLPRTESLAQRELTLPFFPKMSESDIDSVALSLLDIINSGMTDVA